MRPSPISAPPLRFLALVLGGWLCLRAAASIPGWWIGVAVPGPPAATRPQATGSNPAPVAQTAAPSEQPALGRAENSVASFLIRHLSYKKLMVRPALSGALPEGTPIVPDSRASEGPALPVPMLGTGRQVTDLQPFARRRPSLAAPRWSASAWVLLRGERGGAALAPAGTLGGSQAGARILYRLGDGLSLSARAYLPLRRRQGAEAAAGLDWQPAAAIPVAILAERRQAFGREGRSAFSVILHGGASRALPDGLRLDAYAQAGIVGLKSRDLFVDGAARVSAALGPVEVGAAAWAAAQPGAARLDVGPALTYRLPVARAHLRLEADWRFRLAGDAAPGSGPALTLAADF
jgi:hypothetical protein